jgi:acyl dehydratase
VSSLSHIPIEDIKVGMVAKYTQNVTDSDIKPFAGLSGDRNPVHMDKFIHLKVASRSTLPMVL